MAIKKRIADRIRQQLKRYQSILAEAKGRDINEPDTVTILIDMLADLFGYNKFTEVTKEFAIRGTYCDLAIQVGQDIRFLIEAKAIGVPLKENHIKQAVDYAANEGIEWVILTNGAQWQIYKVQFQQPIDKTLVFEVDVLQSNPRDPQIIEYFGNLTKEGFTQSSMTTFYQQQQVTSRFSLAELLFNERVLKALRKEIKKIAPKLKIDIDALAVTLRNEVLKREVIESDEAKQAVHFLKKSSRSASKKRATKNAEPSPSSAAQSPAPNVQELAGQGSAGKS
ncbi:MAG: restriction endonuclease subunit R [Rhodospirillales bacterium]|nr:restriction endonuclease subunit R [Rhodospirillales bacterium]